MWSNSVRQRSLGTSACITMLAAAAHSLTAQATTVTVQGVVSARDSTVPKSAQVEVRGRHTATSRRVFADSSGVYRVLGLAPDVYDVTVRAIGYGRQRREAVRLVVGQRATVDFTLERGVTELAPTVVMAEGAFDLERPDVSTPVLQEEIEKLPLNSRNVLDLAAIAPGIRTYAAEAGRSIPAAGSLPGAESRFANLYVDGVEWKGTYIGAIVGEPQKGSPVPQEAVREFRVLLNTYDAEYSHGAAYIVSAVTHRGGNELEGSLFGFLQNRALVAKGTSQVSKPNYGRYQTGGNLRGPIVRERLFFSASYEGQVTDHFIGVVPGRPLVAPDRWAQYAGTFKAPNRHHTGLLRLTAPLRSHTLDAIWATRHAYSESGFGTTTAAGSMLSHDAGVGGYTRVTSLQLRDSYASSSFVNELSVHMLDLWAHQSPLAPGPTLQYGGIQIGRQEYPVRVEERHLRAVNRVLCTFRGLGGEHALKAGVELTRAWASVYRPLNKDGLFEFATDTSTLPWRARIGVGVDDPASTRDAWATSDGWLVGVYVQDQWRPTSALAITAGVRYDADVNTLNQRFTPPWARDTILERAVGEEFLNSGDRRNDLDNVAPRVAVAWDPVGAGRTFLRGGYGVMYDRVPIFGAANEKIGARWRTHVLPTPGTTDPTELRRRVIANRANARPNVVLIKDRLQAPANHQWSLGAAHKTAEGIALSLDYVNQQTRNVYVSLRTNQNRAIANYGDITLWDDFGDARFRAFVASLTYDRRPTRINVAYTLGWAESEFGNFTTSAYPDSAAYSMQRSEADERHRLVVSGMSKLPLGLELSGIAIVASPRPFLATVGRDVNQNQDPVDDWPNGLRTHRRAGWPHWYRTVDLRLGKSLPFGAGRLAMAIEAFNVFSWANHSEYQATQTQLNFGEPVGDYARRQAQVGVRYQF